MGKSKIRWSNDDEQQLRKSVREYNRKISNELKKNPEKADFLPSKKDIKIELEKAKNNSRNDFKMQLNSIERIKGKGKLEVIKTPSGIKTTEYGLKEFKKLMQRENIHRAKVRAASEGNYLKGLDTPEKQREMQPKKFDINTRTQGDFKKFAANLEKKLTSSYQTESLERFYNNYLKSIEPTLGVHGERIKNIVSKMSPKQLYDLSTKHPDLSIDFRYEPQQQAAKANHILNIMSQYIDIGDENDDFDFDEME